MTPQEIKKFNLWICLNVTSKLRRLSDEEYAEVVKWSEEANEEPHPNMSLTQPYRYEGDFIDYTQPAAHDELVGKIMEKLNLCSMGKKRNGLFWAETVTITGGVIGAVAPTRHLAVMKLARKIEWK